MYGRVLNTPLRGALQMSSWEKVFWKYAANLRENTYAKVQFQ